MDRGTGQSLKQMYIQDIRLWQSLQGRTRTESCDLQNPRILAYRSVHRLVAPPRGSWSASCSAPTSQITSPAHAYCEATVPVSATVLSYEQKLVEEVTHVL